MRREGFLGAFVALLLALVPSVALADSLYRCYNPSTGEHLYTTHAEEVAHLEAYGWNWENQQTMTLPSSGTPVWRLVNTANDDPLHVRCLRGAGSDHSAWLEVRLRWAAGLL